MGVRNRLEDVWSRVAAGSTDDCWPWMGTIDSHGYGRISVGGKGLLAHRVVLGLSIGRTLPTDVLACHSCDNRRCCNPAHLFPGSPADNLADAATKGRMPRGEDSPRAKLRRGQVLEIRRLWEQGRDRRSIAQMFGVTPENVSAICHRRTWRHV